MLVAPLVWPVVVEVAHVLVEDGAGVSFVVDQHPVGALGADAADEPFRIAVRRGRLGMDLDDVDALGAKTASKVAVNFESRSRIRKTQVGGKCSSSRSYTTVSSTARTGRPA